MVFSVLSLVKDAIRTTMPHESLNNLAEMWLNREMSV